MLARFLRRVINSFSSEQNPGSHSSHRWLKVAQSHLRKKDSISAGVALYAAAAENIRLKAYRVSICIPATEGHHDIAFSAIIDQLVKDTEQRDEMRNRWNIAMMCYENSYYSPINVISCRQMSENAEIVHKLVEQLDALRADLLDREMLLEALALYDSQL